MQCVNLAEKRILRIHYAAISKFDNAEVDSELSGSISTLGHTKAQNQINPLGPLGCASSGDVEMQKTNGPQVSDHKPHGWKRLVTERAHVELQNTPMQRKRQVHDEENENEVGVTGKKFCAMDIIYEQTAEAARQPRREQ